MTTSAKIAIAVAAVTVTAILLEPFWPIIRAIQ